MILTHHEKGMRPILYFFCTFRSCDLVADGEKAGPEYRRVNLGFVRDLLSFFKGELFCGKAHTMIYVMSNGHGSTWFLNTQA